jgi:hypothetical protein
LTLELLDYLRRAKLATVSSEGDGVKIFEQTVNVAAP